MAAAAVLLARPDWSLWAVGIVFNAAVMLPLLGQAHHGGRGDARPDRYGKGTARLLGRLGRFAQRVIVPHVGIGIAAAALVNLGLRH